MSKINAYNSFKNSCRESMTFYQQCPGGDQILAVVKDSPKAAMFPQEMQETILHAGPDQG